MAFAEMTAKCIEGNGPRFYAAAAGVRLAAA